MALLIKTDLATKKNLPVQKADKKGPGLFFINKVIKGETYLVMAQSAVELEDEFSSLYFTATEHSNLFLMPPFEPNVLLHLTTTNNILLQCIEAMEVNIDGTGHEFVPVEDGKDIDKAEEKKITAFFKEPYPNESFVSIRRKLRRMMESVGYGYLEVLRNLQGDVVGLRNVETSHIRMVKLDMPIQVEKEIERDGQPVKMKLWVRERRFAQRVALNQLVYYREFGTTRPIHRDTGAWERKDGPNPFTVPPEKQGSELIMFGVHPDTRTPYFIPRWINELPSVVGSRNAEEQNLQFLDAGGMPPAIIFVQGGALVAGASDQLKAYLSGQNKNKNRAVVVEVMSNSGSMDSNQKVDVKTERFGAASSQDAMFMKYDEATEAHVRMGFRLPPLFLGDPKDYNFASAQVAYMVAEAQVFKSERTEFDDIINKTIVKALGIKTCRIQSLPITLQNVEAQLKGFPLVKDVATRESYLKAVNATMGTDMELAEMPQPDMVRITENQGDPSAPPSLNPVTTPDATSKQISQVHHSKLPASTKPPALGAKQMVEPPPPSPTPAEEELSHLKLEQERQKVIAFQKKNAQPLKKKTAMELIELAHDYAIMNGLVRKAELTPERVLITKREIEQLDPEDLFAFNTLVASYAFGQSAPELVDLIANAH